MNRLKQLRQSRGITQDELGRILGVQKAAVCKYETGRVPLPSSVLCTLSEYFDTTADFILGNDDVKTWFKEGIGTDSGVDSCSGSYCDSHNYTMVPLLGTVHAGLPIFADENIAEYLPITSPQNDASNYFFMQVEGDCMTPDHIIEGSLVLVKKGVVQTNNRICVVRLGDEVLLRRVQFFEKHIALIPSNTAYTPMIVDSGDVEIVGQVVEVRISYR